MLLWGVSDTISLMQMQVCLYMRGVALFQLTDNFQDPPLLANT